MKKLLFASLIVGTTVFSSDSFQIKLVDQLDEPEYYCLDVTGWAKHLKLEDPLQAHTCKPTKSADQEFVLKGNTLVMPAYNRCFSASGSSGSALPGSSILVRECDGSKSQNFNILPSGQIELNNSGLCISAGDVSQKASGPSHLWRVASLQSCKNTDSKLTTWTTK